MHHIILTAAVLAAGCAHAIATTEPDGPSEELVDLELSAMAEDAWLKYLTPLVGRSCYPAKVDASPDYSWPCNGLARLDTECMFGPYKAQKVYESYFPLVHNASSSAGILDEVFKLDLSDMLPPSDVVACVCEPRYFELMRRCTSCYAASLRERSDEFQWNTEDVLKNERRFCTTAMEKSSLQIKPHVARFLAAVLSSDHKALVTPTATAATSAPESSILTSNAIDYIPQRARGVASVTADPYPFPAADSLTMTTSATSSDAAPTADEWIPQHSVFSESVAWPTGVKIPIVPIFLAADDAKDSGAGRAVAGPLAVVVLGVGIVFGLL